MKTHYKMISDNKGLLKAYLIKIGDESIEKDYHGWHTYKIWNDERNIWITPPKDFPRYVKEDYRMFAGEKYFKLLRLSFKNKFDFNWINKHEITYALFE